MNVNHITRFNAKADVVHVGIEYPDCNHPHCDIVAIPREDYQQFIYNLGVHWRSQGRMTYAKSRVFPLPNYRGPAYLQFK